MARRSVTVVASDGKREGISWYEGATEAAVLRCALLALGLPVKHNAHLVWQSGDLVDFGKPITDGVTLHLDTIRTAWPSQDAGGYSVTSGDGGFSYNSCGHGGGGAVAERRVNSSHAAVGGETQTSGWGGRGGRREAAARRGGSMTATFSGGGGAGDLDRRRRRRLRRPEPSSSSSESSPAKRGSLLTVQRFLGVRSGVGGGGGGMLNRLLRRSTTDWKEEPERRPLLGIGTVSSTTSLLSPSSSSPRPRSRGSGRGGGGMREPGADEVDGDRNNPEHQRLAILKLKRINALLANERTLLAWVRCVGKMFTVGVLSINLAAVSNPMYTPWFLAIGTVYVAMGPFVVYIGATRFHQAARAMSGSVHDAYAYFSSQHLRGFTFLLMLLTVLTVVLMATQLLATLSDSI